MGRNHTKPSAHAASKTVVECGPGKVLAGMAKRISPEMAAVSIYDPATLAETRQMLGA